MKPGKAGFRILSAALLVVGVALGGCGEESLPPVGGGGGGGGGGKTTKPDDGGATPPPAGSPFALRITSKWDMGDPTETEHAVCSIPAGSAAGTIISCEVAIPEGQLFYSGLKLEIAAEQNTACEIIEIQPYYYQASSSAKFGPSWADTVDCDKPPLSADCFSGPATVLVPGFPKYRGLWYRTDKKTGAVLNVPSAYSAGRWSNRWTCNTLATGQRGVDKPMSGDGYIKNTFQDYVFSCADKWLQPLYRIDLTITDEDVDDPINSDPDPNDPDTNHRADWNGANG